MRECVEEERENPGLGGSWAVLSVGGEGGKGAKYVQHVHVHGCT